jgi:glutathione S-transferase
MKLYFHPFSSNARRARMVAAHLGLPLELKMVDLQKGEQRAPEFLALSPGGKVPVLDDGGFILTESWAIMAYLSDKKPGSHYPTDPKGRALANQWLFWTANHFSPQVAVLNWERMIKAMMNMGPADEARVTTAEKELRALCTQLDAVLASQPYVLGTEISIADFAISASLMTTEVSKLPVLDFAHMQAWFARVRETEAWKSTNPG